MSITIHTSKRSGDLMRKVVRWKFGNTETLCIKANCHRMGPSKDRRQEKKRLSFSGKGRSSLRTVDASPTRGFGPSDAQLCAAHTVTVHFGGCPLHSLCGFYVSHHPSNLRLIDYSRFATNSHTLTGWGSFKRRQPNFVNFSSAWCLSPTNSTGKR